MNRTIFKRFGAYLIDYLFVFLLVTMLSQIRALNPTYDEYMNAYDEYLEIYNNVNTENIVEVVESAEYQKVTYDLTKYSISTSIIYLVVYLAYFVGFQKWNKNQTLGKKMFYLEVASTKNDKVKWWQMLVRNVIIYNLWIDLILIIGIFVLNYNAYMSLNNILSIVSLIIITLNILFICFRKDGRGLHDLIAKTKVIIKE